MLRDASVAAAPSVMAGAPGPSAGKPPADILFTITASRAVLAADTLTLTGIAPVALHTTSGQGAGTTTLGVSYLLILLVLQCFGVSRVCLWVSGTNLLLCWQTLAESVY